MVLWYGGTLILGDSSDITAPKFIYYLTILYSVINPIKDFSKAGYAIPKGLASVERIDRILLAENSIVNTAGALEKSSMDSEIRYNGVSFSYDDGREVLHDINLTIPRGKTVALVGQSGSGKSTMVDLLPRFYDVTGGSITIDGVDLRDITLSSIRGMMGNVNQEAILFNDTFFNNIALFSRPIAVELTPALFECPIDTLFEPVATLLKPIALLSIAVDVLLLPIAVLF